ncbi:hypothetical protein JCM10908_001136 [Rhodotorula pacifica]|uniref:Pch2p n=1 Tax=Rhodotorula pacifica TaxID=1495444 RepID=UPI003175385A
MPVLELVPPPPTVPKRSDKQASSPSSNISLQATSPGSKARASPQARRGNTIEMNGPTEGNGNEKEDDVSMEMALSQETDRRLSLHGSDQDEDEHADGANGDARDAEKQANGAHSDEEGENGGTDGENGETREKIRPPLHVEVRLKPDSTLRCDILRNLVSQHLHNDHPNVLTETSIEDWKEIAILEQHVDRIWVGECSLSTSVVQLSDVSLVLHMYQPPSSSRPTEFSTSADADEDGDSDVPAASVLELPATNLDGIWESLIYDGNIKQNLLNYIYSTILFSDAAVDFNIVTWNRVVLLHGPPGTGKTSLCRALAQKLAIRLSDRYDHGKLVEINSHSLFSKWFSESGKLVQRLFAQVTNLVEEEGSFVVVLIDEVESLTAARAGAMSGKEPSDALRVVNALLTQLDKLKHRKNCLVMTTSNLSEAIDNAFIDRADIKQYIDLPPTAAIYWILRSCLQEIMRVGLVPTVSLMDHKTVEVYRSAGTSAANCKKDEALYCSLMLYELAEQCKGLSGRTLRRLPVLAHARHIGISHNNSQAPKLETWIGAMRKCAAEDGREMEKVNGSR